MGVVLVVGLAGCASVAPPPVGDGTAAGPRPTTDGPEARPPPGLDRVADAVPRVEPLRAGGPNKPYVALGRRYVPMNGDAPWAEVGLASWYGRKYHGRPTASGEVYDMYAMTAAHPTIAIPSYARVRNPANGREVVVRINDRGPFVDGRVIDLSYTAALKLDVLRGVAPVQVTRITHDEIRAGAAATPPARVAEAAPLDAPPARDAAAIDAAKLAALDGDSRADAVPSAAAAPAPAAVATPITLPSPDAAVPIARPLPSIAAPPTTAPPVPSTAASAPIARPLPPAAAPTAALPLPVPSTAAPAPIERPPPTPLPSAAAAVAAATATTEVSAHIDAPLPRGWWLQIGAFRSRDGAEALQRRALADAEAAMVGVAVVDGGDAWWRVQLGPYASRAEAQAAVGRVQRTLGASSVIVERR